MCLLPGEEQTVYVIGEKGIHRHVIGGNMMEQVVDGNLSMLSNPSYHVCDAMQLEDDVFLVLFANCKLLRFTYDPNVPAVPEKVLTVYSLVADKIRQHGIFYIISGLHIIDERQVSTASKIIIHKKQSPDGTVGVIYDAGEPNDNDYTPAMKLILPDGTHVPVELELSYIDRLLFSR